MYTNMRTKFQWTALLVLAAILLNASLSFASVRAATPLTTPCVSSSGASTCDLWATSGSLALPGGSVTIWGYADSAAGAAGLPGPTLIVNQGDTVTVNLTNNLTEATTLLFQGQAMIPDTVGVAPGGSKPYTFVAANPGTYLYEAGLLPNAQHQVAMGLYGALIVRPATAGQAYDSATSAFTDEALVVISEIDPALNNRATPATFDMRKYAPKYFLINGKAFPQTDPIDTAAGNTVLLRYVNAGQQIHSMAVLGLRQTAIAMDGSPYQFSRGIVAESIAPGQTADALVNIPAGAANGSKFALYDASLYVHNNTAAGTGGMLTFLAAGTSSSSGDTIGPAANSLGLAPNPTDGSMDVAVSASISDASSGGSTITAAEFYIDSTSGTPAPLAAADAAFDTATEAVQGTISSATLGGLPAGSHTIYVHGQDAAGNWGAFNHITLNLDKAGPVSSAIGMTPNPANGSGNVALSATADDRANGGSNIAAAEYSIDGGPAAPMTVSTTAAPVASLTASIPAATVNALSEGAHSVAVRSQDALGNWGASATGSLLIDKTGPAASNASATPNPNNGTLGVNTSTPAVRFKTGINDAASAISAAEGFIDTIGANGTGFQMVAADGLFNTSVETATIDIPLTTIAGLSNGNHTLYVHGKDAAGNWGATATTVLVIDKTRPVVSGVTASPNPTNGASTVTLAASATDDLAYPIARAEWFTGADPGAGNATAMTISGSGPYALSASINLAAWTPGSYTLNVRARDAAGNWSLTSSTNLTVSSVLYFSTFGNTNPPGVGGTADDADIYTWDGTAFSRSIDATAIGLPGGTNVDGFVRVDSTHFYLSFSPTTTSVPGIGNVQDEDIVYYNNGTWSVYFDGTARGLTANNQDIDAFDIVGGVLYFSTVGNTNPPGVGGTADDADIYSWNGTSFSRVWDASVAGLPGAANVDGLARIDATHFYLSFSAATTTVPVLGTVQDEDIVYYNNGTWSVYFDGTARGLTSDNQDIDAFDIP